MRKKEVTMQDIGEYLGISKVTVSKALNDKDGVSDELRQRIKEVAIELGYKKIKFEQAQDNKGNIAVVVKEKYVSESEHVSFYLRLYQKTSAALNSKGYMCNLFALNKTNKNNVELPKLFLESKISGVIVMGDIHTSYIDALRKFNIPMILLDYYDSKNEIDCILTDNYYTAYEMTNYLLKSGHRDIGFVGNINSTSSIQDRYMGYYRSLLEAKIPINDGWLISDRDENGDEIEFSLPVTLPSAFVCNCDDTAYTFIKHLKKKGYRVPEDISIVGFDNDIYAEISSPKLTTLAIDMDTMAEKAASRIADQIENETEEKSTRVFVTGHIIYRDSVKNINNQQK